MSDQYKIIHILKHCNYSNGHVHVAVDLACEQASRGCEVIFASAGGTFVSLLEQSGVKHVVLDHSPSKIIKSISKLGSLIRGHDSVLIHAHMMASAVIGFIATRIFGGALVTTVHNSFDGHSVIMRLGDRIVAVSQSEYVSLLSKGYPSRKLSVVLNGPIGSPRVAKTVLPVLELPKPCVMSVSGLHGRKRVQDIITAFSHVSNQFPNWSLVIVGAGPDQEMLTRYRTERKLDKQVVFTGSVENTLSYLRGADVFISMSEAEPFGLSVIEAREAGCAIIVSDAGGMPEIVCGGIAGMVVPIGDTIAAAEAMTDLMKNPESLRRWQLAANGGLEAYSLARMADDYGIVYSRALSDRYNAGGADG